ncbi:hypothetical protein EB118_13720, partial [bacterium]|nr:hypothetical protein [bacterium]
MDTDVIISILSNLDPNGLANACATNKAYYTVCKENKNTILKSIFRKYKVDYHQQRSLVYIKRQRVGGAYKYVWENVSEYTNPDGTYKLGKIFNKYKMWFNEKGTLDISRLGVVSVPKLPNIKELYCAHNDITVLPDFDKLDVLDCRHNGITKLGRMPQLRELKTNETNITEIKDYPNLVSFHGETMLGLTLIQNLPRLEYMYVKVENKIKIQDVHCDGKLKLEIFG